MANPVRETIFENLIKKLKEIRDDQDYKLTWDNVKRGAQNVIQFDREEFPLLVVEDAGGEIIMARDRSGTRYATDIDLGAFVSNTAGDELEVDLNRSIDSLRRFISSDPDLGDNCLAFFDLDIDTRGAIQQKAKGQTILGARLIWYQPHQVVSSPSGLVATSPTWVTDLYTWLETELDELKTTLATGYAYKFDYLHTRHDVANLALPAVTIELERAEATNEDQETAIDADEIHLDVAAIFGIRIHTAWAGGRLDSYEAAGIANSIANKLLANTADSTVDVKEITDITTGDPIAGGTIGSQMSVTLAKSIVITKE